MSNYSVDVFITIDALRELGVDVNDDDSCEFFSDDTNLAADLVNPYSTDDIMIYNFSLYPGEHQPSGTMNVSYIGNPILYSSHDYVSN